MIETAAALLGCDRTVGVAVVSTRGIRPRFNADDLWMGVELLPETPGGFDDVTQSGRVRHVAYPSG
jgi:hypothetical protein